MSTFGLTCNLKSPDRNKQFISNIPRTNIADSEQSSHTPAIAITGMLNQLCRCKFSLLLHGRDGQMK